MTAFHHYELLCDAPDGCDARFNAAEKHAFKTREYASRQGWVHVVTPRAEGGPAHSADFCPTHAKEYAP